MKKHWIALLLALLLTSLCAVGTAEETASFTWWIARSEDTSYYDSYNDNPIVQHLLAEKTYAGKRLSLDFWAGVSGSEKENFNNMLATGDLADMIDLSHSDYTPATLYEDGYILDLTAAVQEHMPNYWNLLQEDSELAEYAWSYVDGEKMLLSLMVFAQQPDDPFEGFCYRRDWVAKYGKNPVSGEAFTYGFDENGKWQDDVVFPCGETDPYYISDWEWMFEIFTTAMADQGIADGYCYSVFYPGYMGSGDLYTGFGGGTPWWSRDREGNAAFGANSDNMRAYLQCMNHWYEQGWMDKAFAERSGDMFYIIDSKSVHQGKVGLWQGRQAEVGTEMDLGNGGFTDGIVVYGCAQPINDVYGADAQKNHQPDSFYSFSRAMTPVALTTKADGKDLSVLLGFIDQFYDMGEGSLLKSHGFSKAQMEGMDQNTPWYQTYAKFGLTEGTYEVVEENGEMYWHHTVGDSLLGNAMKLNRLLGYTMNEHSRYPEETRSAMLQSAIDLWALYPNTGYLRSNVENLIPTSDIAKKTKIDNNIQTYMSQNVPKFIMGQNGFDIDNDADWASYVKVIDKYGPDKVTQMYQTALDMLKE